MEDIHFGRTYKALVEEAVSLGVVANQKDYTDSNPDFSRDAFFKNCERKDISTLHFRAAFNGLGIAPAKFFGRYYQLTHVNTARHQLIEEKDFAVNDATELATLRQEKQMLQEQVKLLQARVNEQSGHIADLRETIGLLKSIQK